MYYGGYCTIWRHRSTTVPDMIKPSVSQENSLTRKQSHQKTPVHVRGPPSVHRRVPEPRVHPPQLGRPGGWESQRARHSRCSCCTGFRTVGDGRRRNRRHGRGAARPIDGSAGSTHGACGTGAGHRPSYEPGPAGRIASQEPLAVSDIGSKRLHTPSRVFPLCAMLSTVSLR
jgi:hypothetical protein